MSTKMKTALLIIDMQNQFEAMTTTALPNIVLLSDFFKKQDWPQLFTQHGHTESDFEPPITNQLVRKWGRDGSIHINTLAWELMPAIQTLAAQNRTQGPIIAKKTYDAFQDTGLEKTLRELGVERVVICGVMTDCCCDTTGRSAFNKGFETWMVSDATGTVDKEQHKRGLKAWAFGYGDVLLTQKVLERLR